MIPILDCEECADLSHPDERPPLNLALIDEVLEQIYREPKSWNQAGWSSRCGTVHCFGGWAVALVYPEDINYANSALASSLLGFTPREAEHVFYCSIGWAETPDQMRDTLRDVINSRSTERISTSVF